MKAKRESCFLTYGGFWQAAILLFWIPPIPCPRLHLPPSSFLAPNNAPVWRHYLFRYTHAHRPIIMSAELFSAEIIEEKAVHSQVFSSANLELTAVFFSLGTDEHSQPQCAANQLSANSLTDHRDSFLTHTNEICIWHIAFEDLIPSSFDKTLILSGLDNKLPENDEIHTEAMRIQLLNVK